VSPSGCCSALRPSRSRKGWTLTDAPFRAHRPLHATHLRELNSQCSLTHGGVAERPLAGLQRSLHCAPASLRDPRGRSAVQRPRSPCERPRGAGRDGKKKVSGTVSPFGCCSALRPSRPRRGWTRTDAPFRAHRPLHATHRWGARVFRGSLPQLRVGERPRGWVGTVVCILGGQDSGGSLPNQSVGNGRPSIDGARRSDSQGPTGRRGSERASSALAALTQARAGCHKCKKSEESRYAHSHQVSGARQLSSSA
jgi:hypothetical protein